jgi:hypothetical protein
MYVGIPNGLYNLGITNGDFQHTLSISGDNDGFEFASSENSLANNQDGYLNIRPSIIDLSAVDNDAGTRAGSRFDSFGKVSLTTDTGTDTSEFSITEDFTWEKQLSLGTLMTLDGISGNLSLGYDLEVLGDQISVNSVPYYFPNTQGLSGTVLTNDGLGGLVWSMTSSLIGSTSGITSNPSPGLTTETWVGDTAGANGGVISMEGERSPSSLPGYIELRSTPTANEIFIDGKALVDKKGQPQSTPVRNLKLKPGRRQVRLVNRAFGAYWEGVIEVESDRLIKKDVILVNKVSR